MKKVICVLVAVLMLAVPCFAEKIGQFDVEWNKKGEYIEITGKNIHLKVYECGKVEKQTWKEINPNEEGSYYVNITPSVDLCSCIKADGTYCSSCFY